MTSPVRPVVIDTGEHMKKYFWSGNTNIKNGCNQQRWGVVETNDDTDPYELAKKIAEDVVADTGADSFCLVAFNEVS